MNPAASAPEPDREAAETPISASSDALDRDAGIVTGIAAEGRVLLRALPAHWPTISHDNLEGRLACAGADTARAKAGAERLLAEGATALVSFGIAGGLDPALAPGALVLPEAVLTPGGEQVAVDAFWRQRVVASFAEGGGRVCAGLLLGSAAVIADRTTKAARFGASGAIAVDMESHAVAEVARQAGVPLLVVRAIADPAERALPAIVLGSIGANGEPRGGLVAGRLAIRPWQLPALLRLRQDARQALAALGALARAAGPLLLGRLRGLSG
ncbi:MAG: hypothetical protein ACFCUQ_02825 [Kiloniellales bacterium]